jgi:hypothetical protein
MTKGQLWKLFYGSVAPLKITREAALRGELNPKQFPKDGYLILGARLDEKRAYCQDSWTDPSTYRYQHFEIDSPDDFTDWVLARPPEKKKTTSRSKRKQEVR